MTRAPKGISAHIDTMTAENLPSAELWPRMDYSSLPGLAALPDQVNCATVLLDEQASAIGERTVLRALPEEHGRALDGAPDDAAGDISWSYAHLLDQANRIAHVLVDDLGVVPGNRVLLRAPNNPMLVACWFAVMKVGAVAVATMPLLRWRELAHIADKARIELALCDLDLREEMELAVEMSEALRRVVFFDGIGAAVGHDPPAMLEALAVSKPDAFDNVQTAADDVALIAFTSGTTGSPKGTMHFHRDILAACECFPRILGGRREDVYCGSPPIAFTFGLGGLVLFPMHVGASALLLERPAPDTLLAAIERFGATVLFTAPTAYRAMLPLLAERDTSSLRACVSAGETLPLPTWEAWREATGIPIIDGIGTTELLHIFISAAPGEIRPGATGKAIPGYQARIVDDDRKPLPPGEVGRLAVRGPTGCRYLADERQRDYVVDGWNLTGDAYRQDDDGYFWFHSRADDMIISSGYNIAGSEVEDALLAHAAVRECAVVGVPEEHRGHLVKAFIVLDEGALPAAVRDQELIEAGSAELVGELQEFVKQRIAPYKYPRAIEFVEKLPRTQTGKVQRFRLRERG